MAVDVALRALLPGDLEHVAAHMRAADVAEVQALGHSPIQALQTSARISSDTVVAVVDGMPAAVFGVTPVSLLGGEGCPWMLGTDAVPLRRRAVMRISRAYIRSMLQVYPVLSNHVHARNTTAVQWLAHIGFEIKPPVPMGPFGEMFHPFEMRASNV